MAHSHLQASDEEIRTHVTTFLNEDEHAVGNPNTRHTSHMSSAAGPVCSSPECEDKTAVKYCDKCQYLCNDCESDHKSVRVLKNHKLLDIEDAEPLQPRVLPTCDKHPGELIKLYCEHCKMYLCWECCLLFHQQHKWVKLTENSTESKTELITFNQQVHIAIENLKITKLAMEEKVDKVNKDGIEEKNEVSKILLAQVARIGNDIDEACHQTQTKLKAESDRLNVTLETLENIELCGEKLLIHGNPAEYMTTLPFLVKKLHDNNADKMTCLVDGVDLTSVKQELEAIKNHKDMQDEVRRSKAELLILERKTIDRRYKLTDRGPQHQKPDVKKAMSEIERLQETVYYQRQTIADLQKRENARQTSAMVLMPRIPEQPQPEGGSWDMQNCGPDLFGSEWIEITCEFPEGIQTAVHPNPGGRYRGEKLTGWIPKDIDGRHESHDICISLEAAFRARVLVTVKYNQLIWNKLDLLDDSTYVGFPLHYVSKIKDDLRSLGIR